MARGEALRIDDAMVCQSHWPPQRLDGLSRTTRWHHSVSRGKRATNEVVHSFSEKDLCATEQEEWGHSNVKGATGPPRRSHVMLGHRVHLARARTEESACGGLYRILYAHTFVLMTCSHDVADAEKKDQ